MPTPIFVSFEGGEGAGKTTQAEILHKRLWNADIPAVLVHEPGSTSLGRHLRDYLKSKHPLSKEAELLLFEAARVELVAEKIKPSLDNGFSVVADRFEASSVAYQGYGRKIDLQVIHYLNSFVTKGLSPNITFLLDLDPAEGLRRVGNPQLALPLEPDNVPDIGRQDVEGHRRFEEQPLEFHRRVRNGFLALARDNPERWVVIDATLPAEGISQLVWGHVSKRLKLSLVN